jgi:Domain of unknown function (DUF3535)
VLVQVVATALAKVIGMCIERKPAAVEKVLAHLRKFAVTAPAAAEVRDGERCNSRGSGSPSATSSPRSAGGTPTAAALADSVERAGAAFVLQRLAEQLGSALATRLPQLWAMMTAPISARAAAAAADDAPTAAAADDALSAAAAASAMQLISCIAPALHPALHAQLAQLVPSMMLCLVHSPPPPDGAVCAGIVSLALASPSAHLEAILTVLLPCLEVRHCRCARRCSPRSLRVPACIRV